MIEASANLSNHKPSFHSSNRHSREEELAIFFKLCVLFSDKVERQLFRNSQLIWMLIAKRRKLFIFSAFFPSHFKQKHCFHADLEWKKEKANNCRENDGNLNLCFKIVSSIYFQVRIQDLQLCSYLSLNQFSKPGLVHLSRLCIFSGRILFCFFFFFYKNIASKTR